MEELFKQYHNKLLRFIESKVPDKEDAKDILSEVFLKIHKRIDSLENNENIPAWIYAVTKNTVIDFYRKNAQYRRDITFEEERYQDEEAQADIYSELAKCIEPIIDSLDEKYKRPLYLSQIQGYTQSEIARQLHLSLENVKTIIFRGKRQIKQRLHRCCTYEYNRIGELADFRQKEKNRDFC